MYHFQYSVIGLIKFRFFFINVLQEENGFTAIMEQMMGMVFPLSKPFIRIRPHQLNTLHLILTKKSLFNIWEEDAFGLFLIKKKYKKSSSFGDKKVKFWLP
jgi:hypothetical protein